MNMLMFVILAYLAVLAWLVISHGPNKNENKSLFVMFVFLGFWIASVYSLQTQLGSDVVYSRLAFSLGLCSILALLQFVGFMVLSQKNALKLLKTIIPVGGLLILLFMSGKSIVSAVSVASDGMMPIPQYGSLIWLYMLVIILSMIGVFVLIVKGMRARSLKTRQQMKIVGSSMVVAMILAITTNLILPAITNDTQFALLLPVAVLVSMSGLAYAIIKYQLFDVRLATMRTVGYILTLSVMAAIYILIAYAMSALIFGNTVMRQDAGAVFVNVVLALLLALIFQPIKHFFDKLTNKIFYRGQYSQEVFLRELGRMLSHNTDLLLLLKQTSKYIATSLSSEMVFFSIGDRPAIGVGVNKNTQILRVDIDEISDYYLHNYEFPSVMTVDMVKSKRIERIFSMYQIYMVLPLILRGQVIGCLFIGDHKSHGYTVRDIQTIESIANELAISVQNSLSVEEVRELNERLKNEVNTATRELRESNKQLQRLDEAKNEFISMASHQLRTPLTSIKGYLDMVLEGDLGKVSPTQKTVLSEAFMSSERMVNLINDFLNVSRLQTGKFVVDRTEGDIKVVLKEQIDMLRIVARQHDLKIKTTIDKDVPKMNIDVDKIRQVILNFIDNAIYYSKPGTTIQVKLSKQDNEVIFKVKDTGIGVPEAEQSRLFGRFFRATNAKQRRPDGTGVGLFLAKKVVLLHGGRVIFESKEGKGSTFGFSLPIDQPKTNS